MAHETFEFIEHRELRSWNGSVTTGTSARIRRSCVLSEVFEPPPELVRAHIATAVDAVLSKGPTPGRRAIERFKEEIKRDSFPRSQDDLARYLRARYFEPGKSSLRRGLAALIVKNCLDDDETGRSRVSPEGTRWPHGRWNVSSRACSLRPCPPW